jgi:hypothetical protein
MAGHTAKRSELGNKYLLELGGDYAGWLADLSGRAACGDIETGPTGRLRSRRDELAATSDLAMPPAFFRWLLGSFSEPLRGEDGVIALVDADGGRLSQMHFSGAVVTALTVPVLDVRRPGQPKLALKFSPSATRQSVPRGPAIAPAVLERRRPALTSEPQLEIDGLAEECSNIRRYEALTVAQAIAVGPAGALTRARPLVATPLIVTLPESKARGFILWADRLSPGATSQRTATLTIGPPQLGFSVVLHNLRIGKIRYEDTTLDGEGPARLRRDATIEMSATRVSFCMLPRE